MNEPLVVPQDIIDGFNSFIAERGGASQFSDFQLDCALTGVTMMRDARNTSLPPGERKAAAQNAVAFFGFCPPPKPKPPPTPKPDPNLLGLGAQALSRILDRMLGDPTVTVADAAKDLLGPEELAPPEPVDAPGPPYTPAAPDASTVPPRPPAPPFNPPLAAADASGPYDEKEISTAAAAEAPAPGPLAKLADLARSAREWAIGWPEPDPEPPPEPYRSPMDPRVAAIRTAWTPPGGFGSKPPPPPLDEPDPVIQTDDIRLRRIGVGRVTYVGS
jgi:hypothetical protein